MTPETKARLLIDGKLEAAGWVVQDMKQLNLGAGPGVAVREYPTDTGPADYILFVDRSPVGVIEASARQGEDYLLQMLEMDAGARFLGEFAFGNNQRVNRGTQNILFDEKMGGTVHFALGASYPETGGLNKSALHWDMICDLRTSGEVWIDDTLFFKDGAIII